MEIKEKILEESKKRINEHLEALPDTVFEGMIDRIEEHLMPLRTLKTYYNCAIMEVETKFKVLNEQFSIQYDENPIESIKTRIKSDTSIVKKLKRKNLPLTVESIEQNIYDVAGVRVITSFQRDIYLLADLLLRQDDIHLVEKKDYIANPKPNGYRSLHLIVEVPIFLQNEKRIMKVEVQLRTIAMDFWASLEHRLTYKKNLDDSLLASISHDLLDCANESSKLDLKMQDVFDRIQKGK